jgi:hypothetical protein
VNVTDNGIPPLTSSQSFTVIVGDYVALSLGTVVGQPGQFVKLPLNLITSANLTNLSFTLEVPPDRIHSLWFQGAVPVTNVQLTVPDATRPVVTFQTSPTQTFQGTQTVGRIWFEIPPDQSPGVANLVVQGPAAGEIDGNIFTNIIANVGRIIVVTEGPLMEAVRIGQNQVQLDLYGQPGPVYELQTSTDLEGAWSTAATLTLTNTIQSLVWTNQMEHARYFRLRKE